MIREYRMKHNLSQEELAEEIGISIVITSPMNSPH